MWTTRKIHQKRCSLPTEIWLLFDMAIVISDSVLPSASSDMWMFKEWDNGYIVVMADYEGLGETEEYIDLLPILKNLYINPETFLKPIKSVKIDYNEGRRD